MSVEYRYNDKVAAGIESTLRRVPADKLAAADMIAFQREVIQELRSEREALKICVAALEEENRKIRAKS